MAKTAARQLAETVVNNGFHDRETNTLFLPNPGISFDVLKGLAKKHNFTVGQTQSGEFVSIPISQKYKPLKSDDFRLYDDFLQSYTFYDGNFSTLLSAYKTIDSMAENLSEIELILDTYVAEVLSQGFIENPLNIKISNKNAQQLVEKVFYKNKIYQMLPNITKSLAKYGNYGFILQYPYLEDWQEDKEIDFKKIDVLEDLVITRVNPKYFQVNVDEFNNPINYTTDYQDKHVAKLQTTAKQTKRVWQIWQFSHFLLPDEITEPYGKSMLWSMRSAFDQLTSLEGLLALSRASKIQRLVFYVPLPNGVDIVSSYGFMNEFRAQYLNSVFSDMGAAKSGRKIPGAMSILTLPEANDGKKVEVDHIESNIDLSSTEDVEYFLDKILRNSSLPKGYLVGEDVITTAQALEAQDLKLKRTLIPLKKGLLNGIMDLTEKVLTHAGYNVGNLEIEVSLNEPIQVSADVISKYNDIGELLKSILEINNGMTNINKFQFLVKLGMPTDIASLICSTSTINVLGNEEDLAHFMINQKLKNKQIDAGINEPDMEESVIYKINSKQYFKENYDLKKTLIDFNKITKTSSDKVLLESIYRSKEDVSKNNDN